MAKLFHHLLTFYFFPQETDIQKEKKKFHEEKPSIVFLYIEGSRYEFFLRETFFFFEYQFPVVFFKSL